MSFTSQCSGCSAYETQCSSGSTDEKTEGAVHRLQKLIEGANPGSPTCGSASPAPDTIMTEKSYPRP